MNRKLHSGGSNEKKDARVRLTEIFLQEAHIITNSKTTTGSSKNVLLRVYPFTCRSR